MSEQDGPGAMAEQEARVTGKRSTTRDAEALRRMRQQVIKKHAKEFRYTPTWKEVRRASLDIGLYDPEHPLPYFAMADTYQCSGFSNGRFSGKVFDPGPYEELEDLGKRQSWNWHLGKNTLAASNESAWAIILKMDLHELDECCERVLECPLPLTRSTAQNELHMNEWFQKLVHVMWRFPCKCGRAELQMLQTQAAAQTETKVLCYCAQEDVIDRCRKKHEEALLKENVRHAAHVFNVITHILTAFPMLMSYIGRHKERGTL